jgi:hypothetical protein
MILFLQSSFGECIPIFEGPAFNYQDDLRGKYNLFSLTERAEYTER